MNYTLAKKLKDAGFPFQPKFYKAVKKDNTPVTTDKDLGIEGEDYVFVPELSELIEACGDEMAWLHNSVKSTKWVAQTFLDDEQNSQQGEGKTPEEAVANLWLELNKKEHENI
jgi:predicted RNase H-like HicB family nuclease